jgi:hypothetical protein
MRSSIPRIDTRLIGQHPRITPESLHSGDHRARAGVAWPNLGHDTRPTLSWIGTDG